MKSADEMAVLVEKSVWAETFSKMVNVASAADAEQAGQGADDQETLTEIEVHPLNQGETMQFCPFERPELICREWINLFSDEKPAKPVLGKPVPVIIDLSPGAGAMALACARDLHLYFGVLLACKIETPCLFKLKVYCR